MAVVTDKTAYGRVAKRRLKMLTLAETADDPLHYLDLARKLKEKLQAARVCIRCGRPLRNEDSLATGLGPECSDKENQK